MTLESVLARLTAPDEASRSAADERQGLLTKPPGALGALETLGSALAAIAGQSLPPVPTSPVVAVFAGDHGVLTEGVSPWPAEVTAQMVANFLGGGAAINVLAREVGARVVVVDVGVATPIPGLVAGSEPPAGFVGANVRHGTRNLAVEAAMTPDEVAAAIDAGLDVAAHLVAEGADLLVTGDMGIGNTTPSAALIAALTGLPASEVTGRGTGITDEVLELKIAAIERGLERVARLHGSAAPDLRAVPPITLLAEIGGLEVAAIAGLVIGGAMARVPVIVDGVIALAGALVAVAIAPEASGYLVAGHRSVEPGASAALAHLGLEPLLDLGLRLGEGSGACLAVPIVRAAARILNEMATFEDVGIATS